MVTCNEEDNNLSGCWVEVELGDSLGSLGDGVLSKVTSNEKLDGIDIALKNSLFDLMCGPEKGRLVSFNY